MATTLETHDWSVTKSKVDEAVRRIVDYAKPLQIIAFGSRARGDHRIDSDLDLAVILESPGQHERSHLPEILFGFDLETDLLVVSKERFDRLRPWLNSVYNYIDREGIILYDREHPERASPGALHISGERSDSPRLRVA